MESENWQRVKTIFDSAFEMGASQRSSFLRIACADDEELLREVEDLLAASETAGSFMEIPLVNAVEDLLPHDSAVQLESGQILGRYRIIRRIGEGGMGEVFLAQDSELDRQVALKILHTETSADEFGLQRFVQEAKSASALNHPNILTIHEIGSFGELNYIATELIDGETLRARLNIESLTLSEILDFTIQIATALNAAHDAGIVHRDIKPENIMIRDDGLAKLLDFGLAKLTYPRLVSGFNRETFGKVPAYYSDGSKRIDCASQVDTAPGMVIGTLNYMSPEQARGKATDARTDIWSLAVVLYEMLAQRRPFGGETASDTMAAILTSEPAPLSESVPLELQRIIKKSLQKSPDQRYHTIKDFLLDVKHLKRELEFSEELQRLRIPVFPNPAEAGTSPLGRGTTEMHSAAISRQNSLDRLTSIAEDLNSRLTKRILAPVLGVLLAIFFGAGIFSWYPAGSASINSVAVMPFVNAEGDPEKEYLSDGLSEALINNLSRLPQLKVIARSSSFQYKGKEIDPQEVARTLGVKVIVVGRVRQRDDDLSISVEMINAADRTQIWGETYNRKVKDAQNIQEDIAQTVSKKLSLRLTGGQQQQIAKNETNNPKAYELRLQATFISRKGGLENTRRAIDLLNKAIELDPNYSAAYALLCVNYGNMPNLGAGDPNEFRSKAEAAGRKAVELDPNLDGAHNALATVLENSWEWAEAEREYTRAIELNSNSISARANYAALLSYTKRHEAALSEMQRAIELDPLRGDTRVVVSYILNSANRYDEAVEAARWAIEINPENSEAYVSLARVYGNKKMYPEAIEAGRHAVELDNNSVATQIILGTALAQAGDRNQAEKLLQNTLDANEYVSPADSARFYLALGEREKAVASLERAYSERDGGMRFLASDPAFEPIRTDPRVVDLLRRMGLPQ